MLTYYVRHCQTFIKVQVLDRANNVSQSCFQSTTRSLRFFELYREFSDKFYFFFRVGGKDKPTRFLSYVEAVHGFRHLLKQEDLDKALSLCTSLKGHLKSRFLVLSDDRTLPPYQPKSGKRSHPDSGNQDFIPGKRTHQDNLRRTPGVSGFQPSANVQAAPASFLPSNVPNVTGVQQSQPVVPVQNAAFLPPSFSGVSGVQPIAIIPSASANGTTFGQVLTYLPGAMSIPPPQVSHPQVVNHPVVPPPQVSQVVQSVVPVPTGSGTSVGNSPSYKTVTSRRGKGKGSANSKNPPAAKSTAGQGSAPGRLTPSRAAKVKVKKSNVNVTSPGPEQYASCEESGEDHGENMEEVQESTEGQGQEY